MRTGGKCLPLAVLSLLLVLLAQAGPAGAACTYSMTNVAQVSAGTTSAIGSLEITLDPATAAVSAGSFVDLSLPPSPSGFTLAVGAPTLINASADSSISISPSPMSSTRAVRLTVNKLEAASGGNNVTILLPLTVGVPSGFTGDIVLSAQAPSSSVFTSADNVVSANTGAAVLKVQPNVYDYGSVTVGGSASETFTVSNIGGATLHVNGVTLSGVNAAEFQVNNDQVSGKDFAPGNSSTLDVIFKPASAGSKSAVMSLASTDPNVPVYNVSLSGTATAPSAAPAAPPAGSPPGTAVPPSFNDLQGHWALSTVTRLAGMGIVSGYPDGTFRPDDGITRLDAVVWLVKALNLTPGPVRGLQFTDTASIPGSDAGLVAAAAQQGLVHGIPQPDGTMAFAPNLPMTRAQFSAMLANALEQKLGPIAPAALTFSDAAAVPGWAQPGVGIMLARGLISGYPDNSFRAGANVTRAEAASMIAKLIDLMGSVRP